MKIVEDEIDELEFNIGNEFQQKIEEPSNNFEEIALPALYTICSSEHCSRNSH